MISPLSTFISIKDLAFNWNSQEIGKDKNVDDSMVYSENKTR
jgi:hypothetical protein